MWNPASIRHAALTLVLAGVPLVGAIIAFSYAVRLLDDAPVGGLLLGAGVLLVLAGWARGLWRAVGVAPSLLTPDWDQFERLRREWENRPA
ncbi:hypothetical protein [Paraconexibacter algicola]|uniref:Uncharacterized protein n=1 Tax=Paraconexibacter algicola TaxID=2133960 RepID=A0A2T4UK58_9ACTN|nr:hypothetical protein [Paraconexibacter algicola]PTL59629.1 hypothetical protein C7Y72_08190 [Paraconexibacter algicola]